MHHQRWRDARANSAARAPPAVRLMLVCFFCLPSPKNYWEHGAPRATDAAPGPQDLVMHGPSMIEKKSCMQFALFVCAGLPWQAL